MIDEQEITLEEERQERVKQLLALRKKDKKYGLVRIEIDSIMEELNKRIVEYVSMLPYSLEFLTLQTIQDFRAHYIVLQVKRLDTNKPVLILRDKTKTKVFVSREFTKDAIKEAHHQYEREISMQPAKAAQAGEEIEEAPPYSVLYFLREEFAGR